MGAHQVTTIDDQATTDSVESPDSAGEVVAPEDVGLSTFARLGIAMLSAETKSTDSVRTAREIARHLSADSRVVDVRSAKFDEHIMEWNVFYPSAPGSDETDLLSGADGFYSLHISLPIAFQVSVPEKNQPVIDGNDDVPTDSYWCVWDGRFAVVTWQQADGSPAISAGHVVLDVLEDALGALGYGLYAPGCEYNCSFKLVHNTLRILEADDSNEAWQFGSDESHSVVSATPNRHAPTPLALPISLYLEIASVARDFVWVKNYGRRVMDLEARVRKDHSRLLDLFARNAQRATGRWYRRAWASIFSRGWRRRARFLIASQWQGMAGIETVRSRWEDDLRDLEESPISRDVLGSDMTRDIDRINGIEFSGLLSALDQVMSHLDTRQVAVATTAGALGGALAGALVGLLAG